MDETDRAAIVHTLSEYFRYLDEGDFASLYLDVMDRATHRRMGMEEFVEALRDMEIRNRAQLHHIRSVRVEDDRAHAEVVAALAGYAGELDFVLVREDGRWRVSRFNPIDVDV